MNRWKIGLFMFYFLILLDSMRRIQTQAQNQNLSWEESFATRAIWNPGAELYRGILPLSFPDFKNPVVGDGFGERTTRGEEYLRK